MGGRLLPALGAEGRPVRLVTRRSEQSAGSGVSVLGWDGIHVDPEGLAGAAGVVHLSGEPVFGGLPSAARRRRIWSSRVDSTRSLAEALAGVPEPLRPPVLVCASALLLRRWWDRRHRYG